jgi:hypothetical protein
MCVSSLWSPTGPLSRARSLVTTFLVVALFLALHAIPARAVQSNPSPYAAPVAVSTLPPEEVQEVLSGIPLEDLSAVQLSELLSQLSGLGTVNTAKLQEALTKSIEGLAGEGATLAQLSNPTELIGSLEGQLKEVLSLPELLALLKGEGLTSLLTSGLGTPEATKLLGGLLSSSEDPKQLIEQALGGVNTEKLDALLGTSLNGEAVGVSTVEGLAGQLGTTDEGLAEALGTSTSKLPAKALALTAPLTNGKTLGMLNGVEGLTLGLLSPAQKEKEEAGGGSGGGTGGSGGGTGGAGGSGGSSGGSSGTPGGTTIVVNTLAPQAAPTLASAASAKTVKIRILSWRVRRHAVTLVVQVPGAGRLALAGRGLRSQHAQAARAERMTLRTSLTRAGVASLRGRGRGRHARMQVRLSFAPVSGRSSSASTAVVFG